jgi:hypothetical protein
MNPDSHGLMLRLILSSRGRSSRVVARSIALGREHQFNLQFCLAGNRREYRRMVIGFEEVFTRFVRSIGGEVLPKSAEESADYLFRAEKVVIELKTLLQDATPAHVRELQALADRWHKQGWVRIYGRTTLDLQTIRTECQREWLDLLETPVERIIRKANRQIRSTKRSQGLSDAKGLLLIVNDGNFLYTEPVNYMILVARILQKKTARGERRFPDIRGVVYFSYRVPAAGESVLFWLPGTIEPAADADLGAFQGRLRQQWFAHFAKITRRSIAESPRSL